MIDSELVDKVDLEPELETLLRNYHLWRRFFTRMIDYQISGLILTGLVFSTILAPDSIINPVQFQNTLQVASSLVMGTPYFYTDSPVISPANKFSTFISKYP